MRFRTKRRRKCPPGSGRLCLNRFYQQVSWPDDLSARRRRRPPLCRSACHASQVSEFPADRLLRAARHWADFSQRELAERTGLTQSIVARVESAPELARVQQFATLLEATGFRLTVVDRDDVELAPESVEDAARRNQGGRRFPAHLDIRPGKQGWWGRKLLGDLRATRARVHLQRAMASRPSQVPRSGERRGRYRDAATSSAICTAFKAAPLRRLSLLTNIARPRPSGTPGSTRNRPTKLGSTPAA